MDEPSTTGPGTGAHRMPRWVKVSIIVVIVLAVVLVAVLLLAGGEHGPGRHGQAADADDLSTDGGHDRPDNGDAAAAMVDAPGATRGEVPTQGGLRPWR